MTEDHQNDQSTDDVDEQVPFTPPPWDTRGCSIISVTGAKIMSAAAEVCSTPDEGNARLAAAAVNAFGNSWTVEDIEDLPDGILSGIAASVLRHLASSTSSEEEE